MMKDVITSDGIGRRVGIFGSLMSRGLEEGLERGRRNNLDFIRGRLPERVRWGDTVLPSW